ncbi:MAG TPA: 30S ribosomal protein S9 [Candidatus Bilamarchaeum sp.]|nr:30S ribosomal protein S9 [Candidatus Bilamarchaeum sp.]
MVDEEKKKKAKPKKKEEAAEAPKEPAKEDAPKTEAKEASKPEAKEPRKRKKGASKKAATKVFVARGKRKESIARATITEGKGVVRLNSMNVNGLNNKYVRDIILEPLRYVGPEANGVDIAISASGGGRMGQAQAARTAIANALVLYFEGMNLKDKFIEIDRSLVVEDTRRVEPKKFRGPKARARFQKSYR